MVGVGQDCQITSLLFNGQVIDPSSYSVANGTHGGVSITYVSPTAERFISKLLPGLIQQSMDRMASEHMPSLKQLAFGKNAGGHADHEWSDNESLDLFGQKGVVLAVRGFGERSASATDTSRRISMLVAPYDGKLSTNLGGFREIYQRGAFAQGLDNDPRALFNHDEACILGRKSAGTAKFWEDAEGVHVECDAPETQWADDLLVSMRRGDITQSSAAFWILQQRWETRDGERVRIVEKALLREASVYSFPAYETATASVQPVAAEILSHATNELDGARLRVLRLR